MKKSALAALILLLTGSTAGLVLTVVVQWIAFEPTPQRVRSATPGEYAAMSEEGVESPRAQLMSRLGMPTTLQRGENVSLGFGQNVAERAGRRFQIEWASTDTSVAVVDSVGRVTAIGVGTAEIVARVGNGEMRTKVRVRPDTASDADTASPREIIRSQGPAGPTKTVSPGDVESIRSPRTGPVIIVEPGRDFEDFLGQALVELIATGANLLFLIIAIAYAKKQGVDPSDVLDLLEL